MVLIEKLKLNLLLLFFVFCLFFQPCFSAEDIINITITDLESNLEVLQRECNAAPFHIINRYNESVHIYYRIDKPSDMEITSYPKDYTLLASGATIAGNLNVCVNEYFENDTYNIKFWVETLTKVNESRVKSKTHTLGVKVLYNPDLEITTTSTTTVVETTTSISQIATTFPVYTTIPTTTIRKNDGDTNGFKIEIIDERILVIIGVIIMLMILVVIPYFTFYKGRKVEKVE